MDISRLFRNGRHVYFVFLDEKEKDTHRQVTRPLSWKKLILTKFRAPTHATLPDVDMSGLFHLATGFIEFCPANAVNRRP